MKKTRFKRLLSLSIVILISSFLLWNCHDEKDFTTEPQAFGLFEHEHRRVSYLENDEIPIHIQDYLYKGTSGTYHVVQSKSKGGFRLSKGQDRSTVFGAIDESTAVAVSLSGQTRYTFLVEPSIPNPDELINLIIIDDEVATQEYFVKYEFDSNRQVRTAFNDADMTQFTGKISYFDGDGTPTGEFTLENGETTNSDGSGTPCPPDDSDDPNDPNDPTNDDDNGGAGNGGCTVNCGGDGHDDNTDEPGGGGGGGNGSEICYVEISYGACCNDNTEPHGAEACGCGDGNLNLLRITTTCQGGSRSADLEPFECDDNDVGVLFGLRKECKKINELLANNPAYKAKLLQLASEAPTATFEKGVAIDVNGNNVVIPNGVGGKLSIPLNPTDKYLSIAHIHDKQGKNGNGTFSVPSLNDLANLGHISGINNKARLSKMVYFVFTADGTHYALTINSTSKFNKFWEYQKFYNSYASLTPAERTQHRNTLQNRAQQNNSGIYHKYYHSTSSLIDPTATNNEQQLKYFLQFLQEESGMGVSVFETDAQLSKFTEVKLNSSDPNGTAERNDCQ